MPCGCDYPILNKTPCPTVLTSSRSKCPQRCKLCWDFQYHGSWQNDSFIPKVSTNYSVNENTHWQKKMQWWVFCKRIIINAIYKFTSLVISLTLLYIQLKRSCCFSAQSATAHCKVSLHLHDWYLKSTGRRDIKKSSQNYGVIIP